MLRTRISTSGQVTIPAEIRRKLGVRPGDRISWEVDESGSVGVTRALYTFDELSGILGPLPPGKDIQTFIDEALEEWGESKIREFEDLGK